MGTNWTLTSAQKRLIRRGGQAKAAVHLALTADRYWCTGNEAITISGNVYTPRGLAFGAIRYGSSGAAMNVTVDDTDGTLRTAWASELFGGIDVDVYLYLREDRNSAWAQAVALAWSLRTVQFRSDARCELSLTGLAGLAPKACLTVGDSTIFPFAPPPDYTLRTEYSSLSIPGGWRSPVPPPGGGNPPYKPAGQDGLAPGPQPSDTSGLSPGVQPDPPGVPPPPTPGGITVSDVLTSTGVL